MNKRLLRMLTVTCTVMLLVCFLAVPAYATGGNVSGAITDTWTAAQGQIKDIVNNVVPTPVLSLNELPAMQCEYYRSFSCVPKTVC